ncbi:MAG: DegT/DnrJ/EryC1/StrS family aminotransferase [Acidobacteriaceae bacterium]|nr:DegT/DnrJ/EryC1/StrS family aminotransferase [Acidobacteriaceae bacterium]
MFDVTEKLAMQGGRPAVHTAIPPRKRHGDAEKRYLNEVIESDILFFYLGTKVRELERRFAALYGRKHCIACSSGTAAVHLAFGALQLPAGTEVITSAITDMGSLTGMLYQGLIPVFADVDPETLNMDPDAVRAAVTDRTGAILAVHHGGLAADLDALMAIGRERGIPVIEDCAQAYGCVWDGELVGRRGVISCFSLNHFKHISSGSGGMILTDDDRLRYVASLFLDKCYQREEGIRNPFFLAPNYQMTEMQGAVALAQLEKLDGFLSRRLTAANRLADQLRGIEGISLPRVPPQAIHSYFLFLFRVDCGHFSCDASEFAAALRAEGVNAKANMITGGRPVYLYDIFQNGSLFPGQRFPRDYPKGLCPIAEKAFDEWIVLELLENYTEQNVDEMAHAVGKVAHHFSAAVPAGAQPGALGSAKS